ncbi:YdeI family protein [Rhizobium sp. L1K21]|uniref:YdeI/OmpD-associated family protein n=1 Tax=Rhizobium sp. L1K21 TaxID=2954933 RepID=UPI002091FCBD|nr:YdeI/OmpD-associated family protein [Rhizobium sp. L1K21]MCO6185551.1 YdeI/OmpD-associated family protein [Rhizobium sp. L1K21]
MITDVEDFFTKGCGRCARFATPDCSTRQWIDGLMDLRRICVDMGLVETVKWAHPCYMHAERNIALIAAFRDDFRLSFMNPARMKDPEGALEKNGPNTKHPGIIRFTGNDQPATMEPVIRAYLKEAMTYAETGITAPKEETDLDLPAELLDALDADPELAEAFQTLTPGRQRSYVINLNGAKQAETRIARIAKFRERILAGKGVNER